MQRNPYKGKKQHKFRCMQKEAVTITPKEYRYSVAYLHRGIARNNSAILSADSAAFADVHSYSFGVIFAPPPLFSLPASPRL